ncbi:hypothetical protein A2U01_0073990, partial [Trifolium medium]|nr:hypothetical protein [Trifolium medium]
RNKETHCPPETGKTPPLRRKTEEQAKAIRVESPLTPSHEDSQEEASPTPPENVM